MRSGKLERDDAEKAKVVPQPSIRMSSDDHRREFGDFTEAGYTELIRLARKKYGFVGFWDRPAEPHVLWRHDLDVSMNRALRLAEIEHQEGVKATYFVFPRCLYYNVFNTDTQRLLRRIIALGHDIALHFDPLHYGPGLDRDELLAAIAWERDMLEREFGISLTAVSFHLFGVLEQPMPDDDVIQGMVNAYSRRLKETYDYVSDSNGVWLYRRLNDVLRSPRSDRLQVLTHPEWWTPTTMPPRARLQRAIDGYARAMGRWYDDIVDRSGRPNLRD